MTQSFYQALLVRLERIHGVKPQFLQLQPPSPDGAWRFVPSRAFLKISPSIVGSLTLKNPKTLKPLRADEAAEAWRQARAINDKHARGIAISRAPQKDFSLDALAQIYLDSEAYKGLAYHSRRSYATNIRRLLQDDAFTGAMVPEIKTLPIEELFRGLIRTQKISLARGYQLKTMFHILYEYAIKLDEVQPGWRPLKDNPVERVQLPKKASNKGRAKPTLSQPEIIAMVKCARRLGLPSIGDAILWGAATGANPQDVLDWPRPVISNSYIQLPVRKKVQNTTGYAHCAPMLPFLLNMIHDANRRNDALEAPRSHAVIFENTRRPYRTGKTVGHFSSLLRAVRLLAGGDLEGFRASDQAGVFPNKIASLDELGFDIAPSLLVGDKWFKHLRQTAVTEYTRRCGKEVAEIIVAHAEGYNVMREHYLDIEKLKDLIVEKEAHLAYPELNAALGPQPKPKPYLVRSA
jgi:hypothetical protein